MARWHFSNMNPGECVRNPIQGEFFASEAISGPAEALVREGIQNSLDAGIREGNGDRAVRVRIFLSEAEGALPAERLAPYTSGLGKHLQAQGNGLLNPPALKEPCPYLVFEDFHTKGLSGDIEQWKPVDGVDNPFFFFLRAEGLSSKTDDQRGRWGVGKLAFPRTSNANCFFALTRPKGDGGPLLMGRMTLKIHDAGGDTFRPDAWFGLRDKEGELVLPEAGEAAIAQFREDFGLEREDESGLSLLVPWYDLEEVDHARVVAAVLRGYFQPILEGELEVDVESPSGGITAITAGELDAVLAEQDAELQAELQPLIELARFASSGDPDGLFELGEHPSGGAMKWTAEGLFTEELTTALRERLDAGREARVRVTVPVRRKGHPEARSTFEVLLTKADGAPPQSPTFIRDGIIIPEVRAPRLRGHRAIVIAAHGPLATLLGDAENPAHTQWNKDCSNFKGKYVYGPSYLRFVTEAPREILKRIQDQGDAIDRDLLVDFFSIPVGGDESTGKGKQPRRKKRKKAGADTPKVSIPRKPPRFTVTRVTGGFTISRGAPGASRPDLLEVLLAYDRRRGNPITKYEPADFRVEKAPIQLELPHPGITVLERRENRYLLKVDDDEFSFTVRGFDENRDLFVKVIAKDASDDQAA